MFEPIPTDVGGQDHENEKSQSLAEVVEQLTSPETSLEQRTKLLVTIEQWLGTAKSETELRRRQHALEAAWVVIERQRMTDEHRTEVLSPAQEKQLNELAEQFQDKQGAAVMLYGTPGTGKSIFLKMLAQKLLPGSNGILEVTCMPMTTSIDLIARPALQPRQLQSTAMLEQLNGLATETISELKKDKLQHLLYRYLEREVIGNQLTQAATQKKILTLLQKIELTAPDGPQEITPEYIDALVEANGDAEQVIDKLQRYFTFVENEEKFLGLQHVIPGPFYEAATEGKVLILNEADKMALNDISRFGWGAEELLQARAGDVVRTAQGLAMTIQEGYLTLVSANDLTKIPDNIQRRFHLVHFQPGVEDLIWQARVLLSSDKGKSIFENREQDEHDLCRFLLWWEALGRHRQVAFNVNALNLLCDKLKKGSSFAEALDQVLQKSPELQPLFQLYLKKRGNDATQAGADIFDLEEDTSSTALLTLGELNWLANKKYFGGAFATRSFIAAVPTIAPLSSRIQVESHLDDAEPSIQVHVQGEFNQATSDHEIENLATFAVNAKEAAELRTSGWQSFASPLGQTALLTSEGRVQAMDMASGTMMEIKRLVDAHKTNGHESFGNIRQVHAAHFSSESVGVMVYETKDGEIKLCAFHKELVQKNESQVLIPQLLIDQELTIPHDNVLNNGELSVELTSDAVLCSWQDRGQQNQVAYLIRPDSITQRFQRIPLRNDATSTLRAGHLGSIFTLEKSGHTSNRQWLRT